VNLNKTIHILFLILCSVCLLQFSPSTIHTHETYVSITSIEIKENKSIEISMELNTEDFIYCLNKENNHTLQPTSNHTHEQFSDSLVLVYINNHFKLKNNNKLLKLQLVGNEIMNDGSFMIYLTCRMKEKLKLFSVENDIFMNVYHRQQNIINLTGSINESITLTKYETSHQFI